jgi:SAM-dependent methyltransferase
VIDLGCGKKPFSTDVLQLADSYIGIDWTNSLHGIHADIVASLNHPLPVADCVFDHVLAFEVIEHLPEPALMLSEAFRILKAGDELTLSVPFQWWVHEQPWDYYRFTQHGLKHLLQRSGFQQISIQPTSGFWAMWFLKLNYQMARLVRGPWPVRLIIQMAFIPFWWLNQTLSPVLDRYWREDRETAGYFVTACKPQV